MGRPAKVFRGQAAQRLTRAVIGQAISDLLQGTEDERKDAADFLFTERSNWFVMSQGISDVESFRAGLRARLNQSTLTLWLEDSKPKICEGLKVAA
jgi:hypothetical protein